MIDVKSTILKTIKDKIDRIRFKAENDSKGLKKLLSLIVLDELYDWSNYLDASQNVQKKLRDLRTNYILCQKDFKIQYAPQEGWYTNVNTPQTINTWKRVWDAHNLYEPDWNQITKLNEYLHLTDLTDTVDTEDGKYLLVDNDIPIENGHIKIFENNINNEGYIIK